ncbi:MAG: ATP-binding cassette domain-containing protein [Gammaproteobacteria bacterium]
MAIINLLNGELAHGLQPLLDGASLAVDQGERIGLIGRNGTGKSSLLRVIHGAEELSGGELRRQAGLRIAHVEQEPELPAAVGLRESLQRRGRIAGIHDERERWSVETRLAEFMDRFGVRGEVDPARASGGERKRAALALALALQPDLLLLDEPTNHLDMDAISLLEEAVSRVPAAILVTHDRQFLDRVTTRIVELDRGLLRSYPGNFSAYERIKEEENAAEDAAHRRFERFWAQEEAWIRQGVKARRTRNEGRVRRLEGLRRERAARRERIGRVGLAVDAGERSGRLVAEFEKVSKRFGDRVIVRDLSMRLMRGDRLALIGANGAGKSTLIRLLLGMEKPDSGTVRLGTNLQVAYFDQMREQLDPERTVGDTISPGSDWIEQNGTRRHIASYLGDFLFSPERARSPVKVLSGGERNRLLLARLFARPANLLVLDEPTNDLDIDTLELLEQLLQDYAGTIVLVSHDRAFLDNVVTQTLVAEGEGRWGEYVGGYSDWRAQRPLTAAASTPPAGSSPPPASRVAPKTKLSYREQRELESIPREIEVLEDEQRRLAEKLADGDYYRKHAATLRADSARGAEIEAMLMDKLERWETLEARRRGA